MRYAGFNDLADYITRRCQQQARETNQPFNLHRLSLDLGWRPNYLYSVSMGRFLPSRDRLKKIADYFGDAPHILYVLGGLEDPPPDLEGELRELHDIARGLSPARRKELLQFAAFLRDKP